MLWGIVRVPCGLTRLQGNAEQGLQLGGTELFPLLGAMTPQEALSMAVQPAQSSQGPKGSGRGKEVLDSHRRQGKSQ